LAISPDVSVLCNKGTALLAIEKYEEAIQCFSAVTNKEPGNWVAWNNKGVAFYHLKKYPEALECFSESLNINPDFLKALNNKGYVLTHFKRYEEALGCFDKILELGPYVEPTYYEPYNKSASICKENIIHEIKNMVSKSLGT